jgi:hypothetical protein
VLIQETDRQSRLQLVENVQNSYEFTHNSNKLPPPLLFIRSPEAHGSTLTPSFFLLSPEKFLSFFDWLNSKITAAKFQRVLISENACGEDIQ